MLFMVRSVCNRAVAIESYLMSLMIRPYLSLKANARYLWAKYLSLSLALCLLPDFHHDWWEICSRESHFKSVYKIHSTYLVSLHFLVILAWHLQNIFWFEWGSWMKFHRWWSSLNKRRSASTLCLIEGIRESRKTYKAFVVQGLAYLPCGNN